MTTHLSKAKLLPAVVALALAAAACGGTDDPGPGAAKSDTVEVKEGGSVTYASEKNPTNFNTLSADGNTFDTQLIVNPVFPSAFGAQPDFSVKMDTNLLVSAEKTSDEPQTIVYKINPKAVWSDGTPISADDFVYAWTTANGKDPGYKPASSAGFDQVKSVTGSDNGKTVTVVFEKKFSDWKSLFGPILPAHFMKTLNADPHKAYNEGLTGDKIKAISGGPYQVATYESNKQVVLKKNTKYWGPAAHLDTVVFRILTEASVEPQALKNKEIQVMYPQPQVDLVQQVKQIPGVVSNVGFGPIFEHFDFNLNTPALKDVALRKALFTAIDREGIVKATVKQFSDKAEVLNNRMLVKGQPGYQDNVTSEGLGAGDVEKAKKILTDAGYTLGTTLKDKSGKAVPTLRMRYTEGNAIRQTECELFQAAAAKLGVNVKIESTDDLGGTLEGRDFDVIVFAWVGTPFPNSANGPLYITKGGSNYPSYSNPEVDAALKDAAVQLDENKAREDLNKADLQLSKDAVTLPLYQKPTFLAFLDTYGNIRDNATSSGPTYNIYEWGLKKSAA
jgi:peptide/nickel transport system substrate-binding protein